jgi:hypothetical protein
MEQRIPKHPSSGDETLKAVLTDVVFRNENGRKLTRFEIQPSVVILTYEP